MVLIIEKELEEHKKKRKYKHDKTGASSNLGLAARGRAGAGEETSVLQLNARCMLNVLRARTKGMTKLVHDSLSRSII